MSGFSIDNYQNIVKDVYQSYLKDLTEEKRDALAANVFKLRRTPRWYQLNTNETLDALWASFREEEDVVDFVLEGTSRFLLKATVHQVNYDNLIGQAASSISWVGTSAIVDPSIVERSGDGEWYRKVFKEAPWVLFLYLLSTVPQVE